ncbi:MAG: carbohydrate porin [Gammaproteobacteria bacterium]|nr:carbohydrate porin [Gammaproteobacteria bacterium]
MRRACALVFALLPFAQPCARADSAGHALAPIGYFRASLSRSEDGHGQAAFQAPGSKAKYRLGNEPDAFGELGLDYRYTTSDGEDAPYWQGVVMLDAFAEHGNSSQFEFDHVAQAYAMAANLVAPGVKLWLGRRYYERKNIEMNDYFWLNSGQGSEFGAGVEGIRLAGGELKLAAFRLEDDDLASRLPGSAEQGTLHGNSLDLRLGGLEINAGGRLTLWAEATRRQDSSSLGYGDEDGWGLGFWHDQDKLFGGSNTFSVLYRSGAAITQGKVNPRPVREDQGYDLADASALEITNNYVYDDLEHYAVQWAVLYRDEDFGRPGIAGSHVRWACTGLRPILQFNTWLSLATELSVDRVDDELNDRDGSVRKATLALQLAEKPGYYQRPVLRLFATYADWSDEFRGLVGAGPGDAPYGDETSGWTAGLQVEAWW